MEQARSDGYPQVALGPRVKVYFFAEFAAVWEALDGDTAHPDYSEPEFEQQIATGIATAAARRGETRAPVPDSRSG